MGAVLVDFNDLDFWARPVAEREPALARLRAEDPVPFFPEPDDLPDIFPRGDGYFVLTRHRHVLEASRQPEIFTSGRGAVSIPDFPPEFSEFFGSIISMDDPRHSRLRRIVSRGFTPRMLERLVDSVSALAGRIIDDVIEAGEADFVRDIAARLPLTVICDMMGIPASQHGLVYDRTNMILAQGDPELLPEDVNEAAAMLLTAGGDLAALLAELAEARRREPTDDLTSLLVNANVDGERLTDAELGSFFILLVVAGNETTRNALAHGLVLLTEHPAERERWQADLARYTPTAVEEIVRIASPVAWMRRTTSRPYTLDGGYELPAGAKVLLSYWSANRDEDVFAEPTRFDVGRTPNPHVGFGGPGPHFCLGAHLARREIAVMLTQVLQRMPDIAAAGPPVPLRSSFINGIKHLPAAWTPARAVRSRDRQPSHGPISKD